MSNHLVPVERPGSDRLHPFVYAAIVGLAAWLVLSLVEFTGDRYVDYLLAVVGGFFIVAAAIPIVLWRMACHHDHTSRQGCGSLHEWQTGKFDIWQGRLKGREAAVQILLPIAAVAFGMTAFGLVLILAV
jgi:hypothetical protein